MTRRVAGRLLLVALAALPLLACRVTEVDTFPPPPPMEDPLVTPFYRALAPHGDWFWVDEYGWVWQPNAVVVGADFVPYASGGTWVSTDWGWSFSCRWGWGWAPFHYGSWVFDPLYGWIWLPDIVWAPAWVDWRIGGGYVGWAPLPPPPHRAHRHQVRVREHGGAVQVREHETRWIYVKKERFTDQDVDIVVRAVGADEARSAEATTAPARTEVERDGARWYTGPSSDELGRKVTIEPVIPPPPGQVLRVPVSPVERALPEEPAPRRAIPARPPARPRTQPAVPPKPHPSLIKSNEHPAQPPGAQPVKVKPAAPAKPKPAVPAKPVKPVKPAKPAHR
jgi:hypothetical protein